MVLHGALASSAHVMVELAPLLEHYRVHGIDVVGQSVMSAETQLEVRHGDAYGEWLDEVMDGLGLVRTHVVGVSWGGFVAQSLARVAPERVDRMVLLVPAGMVASPAWAGFAKIGWPMMMYRAFPSRSRRDRFLAHLLSTPDDPDWAGFLGDAFLAYRLDMRVPRLTRDAELASFDRPVLVIAGDGDLSFPGAELLERARQLFGDDAETELMEGVRHCPPTTDDFRAWLGQRIHRFLDGSGLLDGSGDATRDG